MKNIHKIEKELYITTSEEIKEGDYGLSKLNEIIKFHSGYDYRYYSKIIITTDQDLIGVQAIDDEFLEWFVKNPNCEEVEANKSYSGTYYIAFPYKIIIPKEELEMIECYFIPSNNSSSATICGNCGKEKMLHTIGSGIKVSKSVIITKEETFEEKLDKIVSKEPSKFWKESDERFENKETLEEAAQKATNIRELTWENEYAFIKFIEGAKWQQERSYSEEEVYYLMDKREHYWVRYKNYYAQSYIPFDEWFEKFKKK